MRREDGGDRRRARRATALRAAVSLVLAAVIGWAAPAAWARSGRGVPAPAILDRLTGSWEGIGRAGLANAAPLTLRCRVEIAPGGLVLTRLSIACEGGNYALHVESLITRSGERISGHWTETAVGITGTVIGTMEPSRLRATVSGLGLSGELTITARGGTQAVYLTGQPPLAGSATLLLRRG